MRGVAFALTLRVPQGDSPTRDFNIILCHAEVRSICRLVHRLADSSLALRMTEW